MDPRQRDSAAIDHIAQRELSQGRDLDELEVAACARTRRATHRMTWLQEERARPGARASRRRPRSSRAAVPRSHVDRRAAAGSRQGRSTTGEGAPPAVGARRGPRSCSRRPRRSGAWPRARRSRTGSRSTRATLRRRSRRFVADRAPREDLALVDEPGTYREARATRATRSSRPGAAAVRRQRIEKLARAQSWTRSVPGRSATASAQTATGASAQRVGEAATRVAIHDAIARAQHTALPTARSTSGS